MNKHLETFVSRPGTGKLMAVAALAGLLIGCGQSEPSVYTIPKEEYQPVAPEAVVVTWAQPSGWEEAYGGTMRYSGFKTASGVDIAVTPIPDMRGSELDNVNRWRGQVGLSPIGFGEVDQYRKDVPIGEETGGLYEMVSEGALPGEQSPTRIIAAALKRPHDVWYFKATGPDEAVAAEREKFLKFLASIKIDEPEHDHDHDHEHAHATPMGAMPMDDIHMGARASATPAVQPKESGDDRPEWTVPEGWKDLGASGMRAATFTIEDGDGTAEVSVLAFPGSVGGTHANLDRWRGQVSLPAVPEDALSQYTETLEIGGEKAILVDTAGHPEYKDAASQRIIAVIHEHDGKSWFYKILGDDATAGAQKQALIDFVKSVKYSDNG